MPESMPKVIPEHINEDELKSTLTDGARELGIGLDDEAQGRFIAYLKELKRWNKRINLVSAKSDVELIKRHFLDSLTICPYLKGAGSLLDIGSGAGFPGLPVKIVLPRLRVVLVESTVKKVNFLRHVTRVLCLKDVEAIEGRAEDLSGLEGLKDSFDCVVSRALADLGVFYRLAEPFVSPGGMIIAMKGPSGRKLDDELGALAAAGANAPKVHRLAPGFSRGETSLVVWRMP
jgi:16S rRNA (guanine527-N7)-methyltransferase